MELVDRNFGLNEGIIKLKRRKSFKKFIKI